MGRARGLLPIERAVLSTCAALLVDDRRAHDDLHVQRIRKVLGAVTDIPLRERHQIHNGPMGPMIYAADDFCETFVAVSGDTSAAHFQTRDAHFNRMRRAACLFFIERSDTDLVGLGLMAKADSFAPEAAHG